MEIALTFVRKNMKSAMWRKKNYHDQKLSWQTFEPRSKVYVFFLIRKAGQSLKFTSYWRGLYKALSKNWHIKIIAKGRPQVIHVDRMCENYSKTLRGEACDEERSAPKNGPES